MLKSGDSIITTSNIYKNNNLIKIHPASFLKFPPLLAIGSNGEVVENDGKELFVKFMLRKPESWEQDFLADNTVYFTLPISQSWWFQKNEGL